MADDDELFVIFVDRKINIDVKSERNLKKLSFPQFKSQRNIEIFRNEYSYIVEGVMDILRIVIDIFYKKLNIFLCIDGQTGKYFNKNTNNYKNIINMLMKTNNKNSHDFNKYIENLLLNLPKSHKSVYLIALYSWKNKSDIQNSITSIELLEKSLNIKNIFLYNVSKNYYISNEDCKQMSHSKTLNIRNSTGQFLSMEMINDISTTFNLLLINISGIPIQDVNGQCSFDTNIAIKKSNMLKSITIKWCSNQNYKTRDFNSVSFSEIAFIDNDKSSTKSLISFINQGRHAYLCDANEVSELPSCALFKHGEIFYLHQIEKIVQPIINSSLVEIGQKFDNYSKLEFSRLIKACRLAPYPIDSKTSKIPIVSATKSLFKHFLFFSLTKKETSKFLLLDEASTLLHLMSKPILTSLEYSQCETLISEFIDSQCAFAIPNSDKEMVSPEEILESLLKMAYSMFDQSPSHLKLFGLIKKKATASPLFTRLAPLNHLFPKNKPDDTFLHTLLDNNSSNISLMELIDKHNHKLFNDDKLVPFMGVFDPNFTLYKGVKLSNSREPKNEAFDL